MKRKKGGQKENKRRVIHVVIINEKQKQKCWLKSTEFKIKLFCVKNIIIIY